MFKTASVTGNYLTGVENFQGLQIYRNSNLFPTVRAGNGIIVYIEANSTEVIYYARGMHGRIIYISR